MQALRSWFRSNFSGPYYLAKSLRTSYRQKYGPITLQRRARAVSPLRVVIGTSGKYDRGWIPTDMEYLNLLNESHWQNAFGEKPVDALLAEHVWEHLTRQEGEEAAARCFRYLKPGGYLRVAVPDGYHPDPKYIDWVRIDGKGPGADDHKVLWNFETLGEMFRQVGFEIDFLEYYDEGGEFHKARWSQDAGRIHRTKDNSQRESIPTYSSLIIDARKPQ
jgi:predicted SAM-dependent methyltransferase